MTDRTAADSQSHRSLPNVDSLETQPRAFGPPPVRAVLRQQPEDFFVEEMIGYALSGSGEHLYLWVEKKGANTQWVGRQLAAALGVKSGQVSYAGMKDRHALTRQWFSAQGVKTDPDAGRLAGEGWRVLELTRHTKKLRHGAVKSNRFEITLRDVVGDSRAFEQRLGLIASEGAPNYFGEQRFGYENLVRAGEWARGESKPPDRHTRGIWISALRAAIFNRVLGMRVMAGCWNRLLAGDAAMLAGTKSFFVVEQVTEDLVCRCQSGDISPSGPMWGKGESPVENVAARFEHAVISAVDGAWLNVLAGAGLRQERRSLVCPVNGLRVEWLDDMTAVRLTFALPAGAYATAVLREACAY